MLEKLHPRLRDIIKDKGWSDFTDIQKAAFDPIYEGEHCIIEAPTSGGKTEAVFFPLITKIAADKSPGVKVLYIAPLKALLNDIELRASEYAKACSLEAFKWHGDVSQSEKIKAMAISSEIMLTTPESLEAILLRKGNWNQWFNHLRSIVIDEAHSFAQSDRGSHLLSLLERLEHEIDRVPQRIAVTATLGNPDEMLQWLLGKNHKNGRKIIVKSRMQKRKDFKIYFFNEESSPSLNLALYNLLLRKKSLVFRNSRSATEDSAKYINEENKRRGSAFPLNVRTHHSSVSKYLREDAEALIKARTEAALNAIISTSTLELGIDIGHLDQVVQIGDINSPGAFLQRVGRTGRREDRPQYFRGLCNEEESLALLTACVNLGLKGISENILFPHKAYHILAHQIICLCLQKMGITMQQLWDILSGADCFRDVNQYAFEQLIGFMTEMKYLRKVEHEFLVAGDATEKSFLAANWKRLFAVFDTGPMYHVLDGKKIVGTLDTSFVSMQEVPFLFMLGGIEWKAVKVDHKFQQIAAEKNFTGNIPKWQVFSTRDVPFETAQEVGRLVTGNLQPEFLDPTSLTALLNMRYAYEHCGWNEKKWGFATNEEASVKIYSFCGDKINRTLAQLLQRQLTGVKVTSDYKVVEVRTRDGGTLKQDTILQFVGELKNMDVDTLSNVLKADMKKVWFSKFTPCLPDDIAKMTLTERALDVAGVLREAKRIA